MHNVRYFIGSALIAAMLAAQVPSAAAQNTGAVLSFKPHCILPDKTSCTAFEVADAEHLQTPVLRAGDILDIDIVLNASVPADVTSVRSWLKYDPTQLEARSVELMNDVLPQPIPGEQSIDANEGIIRIGGGTDGKLASMEARVARVTFRVISTAAPSSVSFHNYQEDGSGETAVLKDSDDSVMQLLTAAPTQLTVRVSTTQIQSSSSPAPSTTTNQNGVSSFALLQVQNLQLTSRDRNIFIGWQPLSSAGLRGYNVYYGTVSGRYIQRRSLTQENTSLILRDLEPGTVYYMAVRAFDDKNVESTFSHEVSVTVGRPETSTAPLEGSGDIPTTDGNPIENRHGDTVTGETGVGTELTALLLFSALLGTGLAYRRQMRLSR